MESIKNMKECPDCAGTNIVYIDARDQLVCRDCGLVFEPLTPHAEEEFEKAHNLDLRLEMPKAKSVPAKSKKSKARKHVKKSKPAKKSRPAKKKGKKR